MLPLKNGLRRALLRRRLLFVLIATSLCSFLLMFMYSAVKRPSSRCLLYINDDKRDAAEALLFPDAGQSLYSTLHNSSRPFLYRQYDRNMPLIFIGGVPRSGTTLMRAMLDAHPDIRCGQETRVVPRILQMRQHWMKSAKERLRLQEAGLDSEVLDAAITAFILEVIVRHGEPAARLCNKDPLTLKSGDYLMELFPNAKFLFMVRDGRATVHSIISRKVSITGFDLDDYAQCMRKWNDAISIMFEKCTKIGPNRCMIVYYEQLVLHPKEWLEAILKYLDVPWDDAVLHHEKYVNKPGGVFLSKVERSSDQVIKPVNLEALTKWVEQFPQDVFEKVDKLAPMLSRLGYDPHSKPPNYGLPDAFVFNNTQEIKKNSAHWREIATELLGNHSLFASLNITSTNQTEIDLPFIAPENDRKSEQK